MTDNKGENRRPRPRLTLVTQTTKNGSGPSLAPNLAAMQLGIDDNSEPGEVRVFVYEIYDERPPAPAPEETGSDG